MSKCVNDMKKYLAPEVQSVTCMAVADMLATSPVDTKVTPTTIKTNNNPLQNPITII